MKTKCMKCGWEFTFRIPTEKTKDFNDVKKYLECPNGCLGLMAITESKVEK